MINKDKPAHPLTVVNGHHPSGIPSHTTVYTGLTKRELIAAMAMQGLCSNSELAKAFMDGNVSIDEQERLIVEGSAKFADALLEALK